MLWLWVGTVKLWVCPGNVMSCECVGVVKLWVCESALALPLALPLTLIVCLCEPHDTFT